VKYLEISGEQTLLGNVNIPGSKNSSLSLLAATLLGNEPSVLYDLPLIRDFHVIESILKDLNIYITKTDNETYIDPTNCMISPLDPLKTSKYRASYYFIGALLAKYKKVSLGYPGGDNFVERPIDQHLKGLKELGATVELKEDHYVIAAERLIGADIHFDVITSGATMNLIMAAVLARGQTTLRNAAQDPEVVDTANLLNQMGAKIIGAGTDTIRIEGVSELGGCRYRVIPDRLLAGTFLMAGVATGGTVTVENVIPEHLSAPLAKLREIGVAVETNNDSITVYGDVPIRATRVRASMYPGFATDLQQPFTGMMLRAPGKSIITDTVYPYRFHHIAQLQRMGAGAEWKKGTAILQGNVPLQGNWVHANDVRAGSCLIIAGLLAHGKTKITGLEHIERGYEDMINTFQSLGAEMKIVEGEIDGVNVVSKSN
jgi:UDP-N-acetylglucosamine 1-carboxyvinyltransferase